MTVKLGLLILLSLITTSLQGESVRTMIAGVHRVSLSHQEGTTLTLSYAGSSVIQIDGDTRFFRGIELELTAPQSFLPHHESLAAVIYGELSRIPEPGVTTDLECRQIVSDPLPAKIQTIYQIPLREGHGLRTSPYATVLTGVQSPSSFPILFRLIPVKGVSDELEKMVFTLNVKPILSDEGALRINFRYPEGLRDRPLTVYINDELIKNPEEERLLREGEYRLGIQSDDYRSQSTRFVIERGKTTPLTIELQDPRPRIIFEYPENARVYLDNVLLSNPRGSMPVEPGQHEIRFQISDYIIIRTLTVQRGRTYRVALSLGVEITENDQ